MTILFVKNTNDVDFTDSYNGEVIKFPAGEKVMIDGGAAEHIFGWNRKDKTENLLRLGWANLQGNEGVKRLARFIITKGKIVEETEHDEQMEREGKMPAALPLGVPKPRLERVPDHA